MTSLKLSPPPWHLTGNGTVLLYHFPKKLNRESGFMAPYQEQGYRGWIGAVMMLDYHSSGVGPYRELLYIPGLFSLAGRLTFSVSKIFVSTPESIQSGWENWGIPKELADFSVSPESGETTVLTVRQEGQPFFEARVEPWGPQLPLSNTLLPPLRLTQQRQERLLQTRLQVSGRFRLARLQTVSAYPSFFPPVHRLRPLLAFSIVDFKLLFPRPIIF